MAVGLYGDESETTGKVFTLAGFIASPSAWDRFIPRWRQMLCDTGPYPVDAFHAADIEAAKRPFDGWPLEDRQRLVENALVLLSDEGLCANLYAVSCTFVLEDFHATDPRLLGKGTIADVYERCYRVLLRSVLSNWVFSGIDFIFDDKEKVRGRVQAHFNQAKAALNKDPIFAGRLNDCSFRDDRKVVPLQAADLLAYEIRKYATTRIAGGPVQMRSAYQRIKESFHVKPQQPPYRERLFRCYERRFFAALLNEMLQRPEMTDEEFADLWYHMDAPED